MALAKKGQTMNQLMIMDWMILYRYNATGQVFDWEGQWEGRVLAW